ncbi:MAG: SymE family type I addiction module toxin [Bradyrhizobium sp.]|uniref:SymE family type I addiction module toxin n=1 Tax=Bradyrhizobium sp. TaxID=376 RepID=UPI003D134468
MTQQITIGTHRQRSRAIARHRDATAYDQPRLELRGAILEAAGFEAGTVVEVTARRGRIVITQK